MRFKGFDLSGNTPVSGLSAFHLWISEQPDSEAPPPDVEKEIVTCNIKSDGEMHHILPHVNKIRQGHSLVIIRASSVQALTLSLVVMSMSWGVSSSTAELSMVQYYPQRTT